MKPLIQNKVLQLRHRNKQHVFADQLFFWFVFLSGVGRVLVCLFVFSVFFFFNEFITFIVVEEFLR